MQFWNEVGFCFSASRRLGTTARKPQLENLLGFYDSPTAPFGPLDLAPPSAISDPHSIGFGFSTSPHPYKAHAHNTTTSRSLVSPDAPGCYLDHPLWDSSPSSFWLLPSRRIIQRLVPHHRGLKREGTMLDDEAHCPPHRWMRPPSADDECDSGTCPGLFDSHPLDPAPARKALSRPNGTRRVERGSSPTTQAQTSDASRSHAKGDPPDPMHYADDDDNGLALPNSRRLNTVDSYSNFEADRTGALGGSLRPAARYRPGSTIVIFFSAYLCWLNGAPEKDALASTLNCTHLPSTIDLPAMMSAPARTPNPTTACQNS